MGQPKNTNLTARDLEVAAFVWRCFKTEPTIDYAKLAEIAGFKNPASANACWGATKKKLLAQGSAGGLPSGAPASPATPKTSARKRKAASNTKSTKDLGYTEGTPSKKGKTGYPALEDDDEYGDVESLKKEDDVKEDDDEYGDVVVKEDDNEFSSSDRKDSLVE